ncbi:ABC-F family ATP-binding cassette domain-containing protein [Nocardia seriolae]|uniref:Energy-dependent translational throttle protein EttA n=3 Tax=Nocardia seriolae TaxID=37332 RepID=A0ABC8B023_9NOCA|nr:ATP-binding cassette domain-containing protein [Nocardia seriolae]APA99635.1 Energy-dependent translational throttle protein EttA [Nocardia seriolae]MTJ64205.1 ATP-binding cassette domain-containing protein [Nocardia seriolae]MTJ73914.1 ATP-binding cassette domain-containing protein [Nocardia seriolae]MTJ89198.1 ATP-binding cassette domain-containing protein [Nocardia seriolae]MTK33176.1 ATP-binding cassette domain-containing protein [Nocardia seriolae]
MSMPVISISDLTFVWPDGTEVFDGLDAQFGPGHIGLVGSNGVGKSTLFRLVTGELRAVRGSVSVPGRFGYLRQDLGLAAGQRVDAVLGLAGIRKALHRIESGTGDEADFDTVGSAWDIEERAVALLGRLGLHYVAGDVTQLDRRLDTLSGGETVLLGLVAELLREPDVLLLDEPTNNLDQVARGRLYEVVGQFPGTVLTVSHDRELLDRVDAIAELRQGEIRCFGGNFTEYERIVEAEQQAVRAAVREARSDVRKQSRELVEARIKLDRRLRYGQKMWDQKREPKIVMAERRRQAQVSAGKLRNNHIGKVEEARDHLSDMQERVRDDREIRVDLPGTRLYPGQDVLELNEVRLACGPTVTLKITGPERIALTGRNGIGKTTLLHRIRESGPKVAWRMLPQRLDVFDESRSVFENVAATAPHAAPERIRAQLARFLFRGGDADVPAAALSGGERLRAALAMLLLAEPAPKLLLLDEPTNNLDLPSLAHLTEALAGFEGALMVVSHDPRFLAGIGVTRRLELTAGGLVESPGEQ